MIMCFKSCKGCAERTPGCHDKCEKYQKEKAEYEALKEKQTKKNIVRAGLEDQRYRAVRKAVKHQGRSNGHF